MHQQMNLTDTYQVHTNSRGRCHLLYRRRNSTSSHTDHALATRLRPRLDCCASHPGLLSCSTGLLEICAALSALRYDRHRPHFHNLNCLSLIIAASLLSGPRWRRQLEPRQLGHVLLPLNLVDHSKQGYRLVFLTEWHPRLSCV